MSKQEKPKSDNSPKSGAKSIQDFGKKEIKNLDISDYTKPTSPPPKPKSDQE